MIVAACVVDHVTPHRGNEDLFFDYHNTQSLCKAHHDSTKQSMERGSVPKDRAKINPKDGWPFGSGGE